MVVLVALSSCGGKKETAQEQTVRVKVQQIQTEAVNGEQGFSGTIEESSGTSLSFAVSGTIKRILVSAGQTVGAGQLIAELDPTTLQHAYTISKTALEQAQDTYNRMKELHDAGSLPEMQWIQIDNQLKTAKASEAMAKKSLSDTKLVAPFSGYIASKDAEMGQVAGPGISIAKLVNIGSVKVKIAVPEDDVQRIAKGSSMKIIVPALNNREFEGYHPEPWRPAVARHDLPGLHELYAGHNGRVRTRQSGTARRRQQDLRLGGQWRQGRET